MTNAIKLGGILAAISTITSCIMVYALSPEIMFTSKYMAISLGISLLLMIVLGRMMLRPKDYAGLTYGEALKYLFVASMVSFCIGQVASNILYGNNEKVRTAFNQYAIDTQIGATKMGMSLGGADEARIEEAVDDIKDQIESGEIPLPDYPFEWSNFPTSILSASFMALLFSFIAAIFVKQKG